MGVQEEELVAFIADNPGVKPSDLAQHFDVSVRTIRTHVTRANESMRSFARIELVRGSGYRLSVSDEDAYRAWSARSRSVARGVVPSTPAERVRYLLNDLLMRSDWITLDDLSNILFVSRSAISRSLKQVERTLGNFGLSLEKRPHYGIRVAGPELKRRLCLANVIIDEMDNDRGAQGDAADVAHAADPSGDVLEEGIGRSLMLDTISACVERVTAQEGFVVNSVAYQNLLVHIAVALVRIKSNCYVPMPLADQQSIKESHEYGIAEKIAAAVQKEADVALPDEEVAYIAIHLAGKQAIVDEMGSDDDAPVISDEVWTVVSRMLELV